MSFKNSNLHEAMLALVEKSIQQYSMELEVHTKTRELYAEIKRTNFGS
ncbi:MAG: hypothetical protein WAK17_28625 [Candidatus Nitrosopolaris sp.]